MKILLTGHLGFIGTALGNRLLNKKYEVIGIDSKNGKEQDLLNITQWPKNIDLVIHLAGKSGVRESLTDPAGYWFNNCLLYTSPSPRDRQKSRMPSSA